MVADGLVRREDKEGNFAADIAADFEGVENLRWLLMPVEICSELKWSGILECRFFIGTWLLLLGSL